MKRVHAIGICVAIGAALAVGVVGIVIGLKANSDANTLQTQLHTEQGKVNAEQGKINADQAQISTLQSSSQTGTVANLQADMHTLKTCLPQLSQEIGSLSISWRIDPITTSNDQFNISNPTIISRDCTKILAGY